MTYKIEKGVPLPPKRSEGNYAYKDVPFDEMEVNDCVTIPINQLIPDKPHPDTRERSLALACMSTYLSRKYPDKKFTYRMEKPVWGYRFRKDKEKLREANLNRVVRVWRVK
jgi:hypothetical protein